MQYLQESLFFGVMISFLGYHLGTSLKKKFNTPFCNPLLIAIISVMLSLKLLKVDYNHYYEGAKYISYLLTPATICLAVPLYEQIHLLKKHMHAILLGILSGVIAGFISIYFFAVIFNFTHEQYVTMLPKSITTAIGMSVSEELGGIVTITVAAIIITGIVGNAIAEMVCRVFKINEPVAKGVAIGTAAHAVGTAKAVEIGEIEGAMSGLAIAIAGLMTVVGVPLVANLL